MKCFLLLLCVCIMLQPTSYALAAEGKPSLKIEDLGFKKEQTQANPELQLMRESRASKLNLHQTMAFVTWGLMGTTLLFGGKAKHGDSNIHKIGGFATGAAYATTAFLSMSAPDPDKVSGTTGLNIKIHKILRWVHLPLMIITPIAGIQAEKQNERNQPHTGLGKWKPGLGAALFLSYTLAGSVMLFEF